METSMLNAVELDFDFGIPEKKLKDIAKRMLPTVSKVDSQGCLQAMQLMRKDNTVIAYSTEVHRLSEYTFDSPGQDYNVLIYKDYLKELKKTGKLSSDKVTGETSYPKCAQLIPNSPDHILISDIKNLIKDINYYRNKKHTIVKIALASSIIALDAPRCKAEGYFQIVKADLELLNFTRKDLEERYLSNLLLIDEVVFNINYFVDALKAINSDTIQISTNLNKPGGLKRLKNPEDKEFSVHMMPVILRK